MTDWKATTLGEECDLLTGHPFKSKKYTTSSDGIKLVRGDNIVQGRLRWDGVKLWPANATDGLEQYQLQESDVVLAMDRPWIEAGLKYASISTADLPALLVQRVSRLRGKKKLNTTFLKYLIGSRSFTNHVLAVQTGTAVPHISSTQIKAFAFELPPPHVQRQIAEILGSLDDKIELNRRMNETLEAMVRRLFRSWFVDFDPVHAKAAVRREHPKWDNTRVSREALPKLDPAIAEAFSDDFEETELGPIPKGWRVGTVHDLAALDKTSVKPAEFPTEEFDHYSIPAYDEGQQPARDLGDSIKSNKFLVSEDCVLLTKLNPRIPRVWLPNISASHRSICSTEFLVLRPKDGVSQSFLFAHVSSSAFFGVYQTMVTGTSGSHQRIRPDALLAMAAVLPPSDMIDAFTETVVDLLKMRSSLRTEAQQLASTRDKLLPRLLSGELNTGVATE